MALVVAPEFPIGDWFAQLDRQIESTPDLFADRPVVADLTAVVEAGWDAPPIVLDGLEARGLRLVGVEGVPSQVLAGARWERLATTLRGRDTPLEVSAETEAVAAPAAAPPPFPSFLIDRPVRSGQSIVFEEGDVTIVGSVGSGAEVIAGGSVHVYGTLRGRVLAGVRNPEAARIFCSRLEAELVAIGPHYRTAEDWGEGLQGRAVQVICDRGALRLSALD